MDYRASFTCDCEVCGKRYSGQMSMECPKNDSKLAGDTLNQMADSVDFRWTMRRFENAVSDKNWDILKIEPAKCPFCGAWQTWNPPKKPGKPDSRKGERKTNLLLTGVLVVFGAVFGLLLGLILFGIVDEVSRSALNSDGFLYGGAGFDAGIGCLLGMCVAKATKEPDEMPQKKSKQYEEVIQSYWWIEGELKERAVRNQPIVESAEESRKKNLHRDASAHSAYETCPSCGGKLMGTVKLNSVELGRAVSGCCPWCGAKLPGHIHLNVGK